VASEQSGAASFLTHSESSSAQSSEAVHGYGIAHLAMRLSPDVLRVGRSLSPAQRRRLDGYVRTIGSLIHHLTSDA
jgi:hypothetical protein